MTVALPSIDASATDKDERLVAKLLPLPSSDAGGAAAVVVSSVEEGAVSSSAPIYHPNIYLQKNKLTSHCSVSQWIFQQVRVSKRIKSWGAASSFLDRVWLSPPEKM